MSFSSVNSLLIASAFDSAAFKSFINLEISCLFDFLVDFNSDSSLAFISAILVVVSFSSVNSLLRASAFDSAAFKSFINLAISCLFDFLVDFNSDSSDAWRVAIWVVAVLSSSNCFNKIVFSFVSRVVRSSNAAVRPAKVFLWVDFISSYLSLSSSFFTTSLWYFFLVSVHCFLTLPEDTISISSPLSRTLISWSCLVFCDESWACIWAVVSSITFSNFFTVSEKCTFSFLNSLVTCFIASLATLDSSRDPVKSWTRESSTSSCLLASSFTCFIAS